MLRTLPVVLCLCLAALPELAIGEETTAFATQVREWITQLGDDRFDVRDAAFNHLRTRVDGGLLNIDLDAKNFPRQYDDLLECLQSATKHEDAEIRTRVRELLKTAPGFPLSKGLAGWALAAASSEFQQIPPFQVVVFDRDLSVQETLVRRVLLHREGARNQCRYYTLKNMAQLSAIGALRSMEQGEFKDYRREVVIPIVAEAWAQQDFAAALAWSRQLGDARQRRLAQARILRYWPLDRSVDEAMLLANDLLTDRSLTEQAMQSYCHLAGIIARDNPQAAFDWAKHFAETSFLADIQGCIVHAAIHRHYDLVVELSQAHNDAKLAVLRWQLQTQRPIDAAYVESTGTCRVTAEGIYLRQLAGNDIQAALARWEKIRSETFIEQGLANRGLATQIAQAWAVKDPDAALKWISSIPELRSSVDIWLMLPTELAQKDPAAAATLVEKIPHLEGRKYAAQRVGAVWLTRDGAVALPYLEKQGLRDVDLLAPDRNGVISTLGANDPERAATWLAKHVDNILAEPAHQELGRRWAQRDPRAAVKWSLSLTNPKLRAVALFGVARGTIEAADGTHLQGVMATSK